MRPREKRGTSAAEKKRRKENFFFVGDQIPLKKEARAERDAPRQKHTNTTFLSFNY